MTSLSAKDRASFVRSLRLVEDQLRAAIRLIRGRDAWMLGARAALRLALVEVARMLETLGEDVPS